MNILYLDEDPRTIPIYLIDRHTHRMAMEALQLLSTVAWCCGIPAGWQPTFIYHPCNVWARTSIANYVWLAEFAKRSVEEHEFRRDLSNKIHPAIDEVISLIPYVFHHIPDIGLTPFHKGVHPSYKLASVRPAYRAYYITDKARSPKWSKRPIPFWFPKDTVNLSPVGFPMVCEEKAYFEAVSSINDLENLGALNPGYWLADKYSVEFNCQPATLTVKEFRPYFERARAMRPPSKVWKGEPIVYPWPPSSNTRRFL